MSTRTELKDKRSSECCCTLHLVTTCQLNSAREKSLNTLRESISASARQTNNLRIRHYILFQGVEHAPSPGECFSDFEHVALTVNRQVSLSKARNIILKQILPHIKENDIVAFPDDDCSYEPGAIKQILQYFATNSRADLVIASEADMQSDDTSGKDIATPRIMCTKSTSNVIFVRGRIARMVEAFNEAIGLGATYNGGEDIDYALRAYSASQQAIYAPSAKIRHRPANPAAMRGPYFPGSYIAITSAVLRNRCFFLLWLRKTMIGIYYVSLGELSLKAYFSSLIHGLRGDCSMTRPFASDPWSSSR